MFVLTKTQNYQQFHECQAHVNVSVLVVYAQICSGYVSLMRPIDGKMTVMTSPLVLLEELETGCSADDGRSCKPANGLGLSRKCFG